MRTLALSLLTGAAVAFFGCGGHAPQAQGANAHATSARTPAMTELTTIGQLQTQFNDHPDVPRLIVLMSPT